MSNPSITTSLRSETTSRTPATSGGTRTSRSADTSRGTTTVFRDGAVQRRYWIIIGILLVLATGFTAGLLMWNNPMPVGTEGFWLIARRRLDAVIAMIIVAACQSIATVAFQSIANNRIITPSIMGFEALYIAISTAAVYFFGVTGLMNAESVLSFVIQLVMMVGLALALYAWLLLGKGADMHTMLLVGIIIGGGLASVSTFMQRLLTPSEFDVLTARLFGSVNNADSSFYPVAIPLMVVGVSVIFLHSRQLNVMALGKEVATGLGINHQRSSIIVLISVAVLMAVSTAMVGPMTFLGFLVATLSYQVADTYDHRYILPAAALIGYVTLAGAYFILNHVFYAQGVVSIIIELIGGSIFLYVVLKKGRL